MAVPSSTHSSLVTKSMALGLFLVLLLASLPRDCTAASGGAVGGGFASRSSPKRTAYWTPSTRTTYVYRDSYWGYRHNNYYAPRQHWMDNTGVFTNAFITIVVFLSFVAVVAIVYDEHKRQRRSVVKLQVALKGTASSFQQDLNRIAQNADTSTQEGYKYVLEESAMALLRHADYWLFSYFSEEIKSDEKQAERLFYDLSFEERTKFDEETLVNVDKHQEQKNILETATSLQNPFIVVNLLVATAGQLKLSPINTATDLKAILKKLGALPKSEILAAHVLWTPQEEKDYLSSERLLKDYPLLRELKSDLN